MELFGLASSWSRALWSASRGSCHIEYRDAFRKRAEPAVRANALTGAAIFRTPRPLDAAFSLEESRLCADARGSPLTFGGKMKKTISPWTLLYLCLVVLGAATLGLLFLVIARQEREQMILVFGMTVAGGGAIIAGLIGLLVLSIKHVLKPVPRKEPNQSPEPTR
jgi:hypothetical protein